jgi:polyhydroxybutyrate depolymerase
MRKTHLFLLSLALLCSFTVFSQQTIKDTITVNGVERTYLLYIPDMYDGSVDVPLLNVMHGRNGASDRMLDYADFRPIADTAGVILVYPQGLPDNLGRTHWNFNPSMDTTDDIGFLDSLIRHLLDNYSIDQKRVYSTGFSQGGFMSFFLVCNLGHRLAGIGSVGGAVIDTSNCYSGFPMPIIQIHGTSDDQVGYDQYKVDNLVKICAAYNGCNPNPVESNLPDLNSTDNSTVTKFVYEGGRNDAIVEHFRVNGGEHTWPGANENSPSVNYDIDACQEIWRFLSKYNKDGFIAKASQSNAYIENTIIYPNPSNGLFVIKSNHNLKSVSISDLQGKVVFKNTLSAPSGYYELNTSMLSPGVYVVQIESTQGTQMLKIQIR